MITISCCKSLGGWYSCCSRSSETVFERSSWVYFYNWGIQQVDRSCEDEGQWWETRSIYRHLQVYTTHELQRMHQENIWMIDELISILGLSKSPRVTFYILDRSLTGIGHLDIEHRTWNIHVIVNWHWHWAFPIYQS